MAVRFDALNERYSGATPTAPRTFVLWCKIMVDRNTWQRIISLGNDWAYLGTDVDGTSVVYSSSAAGTAAVINMTVGQWYRLALVRDASNVITIYGADAFGATATQSVTSATAWNELGIGGNPGGTNAGEWLNGSVAALKEYSAVLTLGEIENEWAQYTPQRTTNLVRWHPFLVNELINYSQGANLTAGSVAASTDPDGPPIRWSRSRGPRVSLSPTGTNVDAQCATWSAAGQDAGASLSVPFGGTPAIVTVTADLDPASPMIMSPAEAATAVADGLAASASLWVPADPALVVPVGLDAGAAAAATTGVGASPVVAADATSTAASRVDAAALAAAWSASGYDAGADRSESRTASPDAGLVAAVGVDPSGAVSATSGAAAVAVDGVAAQASTVTDAAVSADAGAVAAAALDGAGYVQQDASPAAVGGLVLAAGVDAQAWPQPVADVAGVAVLGADPALAVAPTPTAAVSPVAGLDGQGAAATPADAALVYTTAQGALGEPSESRTANADAGLVVTGGLDTTSAATGAADVALVAAAAQPPSSAVAAQPDAGTSTVDAGGAEAGTSGEATPDAAGAVVLADGLDAKPHVGVRPAAITASPVARQATKWVLPDVALVAPVADDAQPAVSFTADAAEWAAAGADTSTAARVDPHPAVGPISGFDPHATTTAGADPADVAADAVDCEPSTVIEREPEVADVAADAVDGAAAVAARVDPAAVAVDGAQPTPSTVIVADVAPGTGTVAVGGRDALGVPVTRADAAAGAVDAVAGGAESSTSSAPGAAAAAVAVAGQVGSASVAGAAAVGELVFDGLDVAARVSLARVADAAPVVAAALEADGDDASNVEGVAAVAGLDVDGLDVRSRVATGGSSALLDLDGVDAHGVVGARPPTATVYTDGAAAAAGVGASAGTDAGVFTGQDGVTDARGRTSPTATPADVGVDVVEPLVAVAPTTRSNVSAVDAQPTRSAAAVDPVSAQPQPVADEPSPAVTMRAAGAVADVDGLDPLAAASGTNEGHAIPAEAGPVLAYPPVVNVSARQRPDAALVALDGQPVDVTSASTPGPAGFDVDADGASGGVTLSRSEPGAVVLDVDDPGATAEAVARPTPAAGVLDMDGLAPVLAVAAGAMPAEVAAAGLAAIAARARDASADVAAWLVAANPSGVAVSPVAVHALFLIAAADAVGQVPVIRGWVQEWARDHPEIVEAWRVHGFVGHSVRTGLALLAEWDRVHGAQVEPEPPAVVVHEWRR